VIRFRNRSHDVYGYSRTLPYVDTELKPAMQKIDAVLTSAEEFGGPATILETYASRRFMGDNPMRTEGGEQLTLDGPGAIRARRVGGPADNGKDAVSGGAGQNDAGRGAAGAQQSGPPQAHGLEGFSLSAAVRPPGS
jgi:hypothetical protein